ncbi:MAG: tRNA pseudouridine(55) synthase TruB [Planctomycetes bacterium]|nr:tRNA pseudouridine(55) synthase TruB [Planctomycetota bacterium]
MNGILVIDKPGGMTSRDAVNRVQRWFPRKTKIGHTGTLDPLATGVLVVCVGLATRLADYVQAMGKSYTSRVRLGATSTSDDADGDVTETNAPPVSREQIDAALVRFVGVIEQVPPAVSALRVGGRRAHDLVRKGKEVALAARSVRVDAIRVTGFVWPYLDVEVDCGKGTYIRSIARDLGAALGCGGMVQTLRRTRVGPFAAGQGVGVDEPPAELKLQPMLTVLAGFPQLPLSAEEALRLRQGQRVPIVTTSGRQPPEGVELALLGESGELVGIGIVERGVLVTRVMFHQ